MYTPLSLSLSCSLSPALFSGALLHGVSVNINFYYNLRPIFIDLTTFELLIKTLIYYNFCVLWVTYKDHLCAYFKAVLMTVHPCLLFNSVSQIKEL